MLGSAILDVAIGLVFVYLLMGLLVSAASELIAAALHWRAENLQQGLRRMLNPELAAALYSHPLVSKLSKGGRGPSYIPSETFALALVDVLAHLPGPQGQPARDLVGLIDNVPDPEVQRVLRLLAAEAGPDGERLRKNIEHWFNTSMDRVAGWYKRKSQITNVITAVVLAVAVNADSVKIVQALSNDLTLRAALVAQAQEAVKQPPPPAPDPGQTAPDFAKARENFDQRIEKISRLGLPLGWMEGAGLGEWPGWTPGDKPFNEWAWAWARTVRHHVLGWLLTALAASMGAPFWFDVLKKIITVRSAGRAPGEQKPSPAPQPART